MYYAIEVQKQGNSYYKCNYILPPSDDESAYNYTYKMISNIHFMLHRIPNTLNLIDQLIYYCPWISRSPAVEPVVSPRVMKKTKPKLMKKAKKTSDSPLKKSKHCPC